MKRLALLGFGTVGQAVYALLKEQRHMLELATSENFEVTKILVKNTDKYKTHEISDRFTNDIYDCINDDSIDILLEMTGAVEELILPLIKAMNQKKHVITANKALVSKYFSTLSETAQKNNVFFEYEASVGGAIPIIAPLKKLSVLNSIQEIHGVLNGTCNFILSQMEDGKDYQDALLKAQVLGYAEADPSADVEGLDTLRKLVILSSLCFEHSVEETDIPCTGITSVTKEQIEEAKQFNQHIKLVASAIRKDNRIELSVKPQRLKKESILGGLTNSENAIIIKTSNAGEFSFKGLGAGGRPTATAMLSDLMEIIAKIN